MSMRLTTGLDWKLFLKKLVLLKNMKKVFERKHCLCTVGSFCSFDKTWTRLLHFVPPRVFSTKCVYDTNNGQPSGYAPWSMKMLTLKAEHEISVGKIFYYPVNWRNGTFPMLSGIFLLSLSFYHFRWICTFHRCCQGLHHQYKTGENSFIWFWFYFVGKSSPSFFNMEVEF